jgi:nickel-type superoxide dismutase maturation protease
MFRERSLIRVLVATLLVLLAMIVLCTRFIAIPWTVDGTSMAPTLSQGDRVLVDLWTFRRRPPEAGEMVLLDGPGAVRMVKRVSNARPENGFVHVLGDNPDSSVDSRQFGPVPREAIRGRVFFRYWPLSEAGPIR